MATAAKGVSYAHGKWAASDAAWCDFMDRAQEADERADVRDAMLRVLRRIHVHLWPADHWKDERGKWAAPYTGRAIPAARASISELARESGLTSWRVRTAISAAERHGLLVQLMDAKGRGEGRGATPSVYTFGCYLDKSPTTKPKPKASDPKDGKKLSKKWGIAIE